MILIITLSYIAVAYDRDTWKRITQLIREKDFEQVEKYLDELLTNKESKEIYSEYRDVIVNLEQHCEVEKALEFVNKYIDTYPDSGDAYFYREQGLFLTELNRYQEAIESFEKFVAHFKGSIHEPLARYKLGMLYFRTQEYEKALSKDFLWRVKQ